jgi:hypothetical protein
MMASAISVLPVPVGLTITPRHPARSQAAMAASWSGRKRRQGGRERGTPEEVLGAIVERQVVRSCLLPQPRVVERFGAPGPDAVVPPQVWRHTHRPGRVEP